MESTIEQPRQAGFPRRVSSRLLPQSWQMPFTTAGFPASTLNNSSTGMSLVFVFFCFLGLWKETAILVVRAAIRSLVSLFESVSFEGLGCGMSSSLEESSNFLGTTPLNCWVSAIFLTTKAARPKFKANGTSSRCLQLWGRDSLEQRARSLVF